MSIEIIVEVMEHSPKSLTAAERCALMILAEDARLPSREIKHDIDDEYLLQRLQLSAASWSNTRSSLQRKKVLEKISGGHNGKRARYRIPILDEAMKVNRSGEATGGSSSTDSVEQEDELVNRSGESSSTDPVDLTYITPVTPSTTPKAEGEERSSTNRKQPANHTGRARALIAASPIAHQLGRAAHARVLAAVDELLGLGWPESDLARRLAKQQPPVVHDLASLVVSWLPEAEPYRPPVAAQDPVGPPPWCGTCGPLVEGNSVARVNIRFRTLTGKPGDTPCPNATPKPRKVPHDHLR